MDDSTIANARAARSRTAECLRSLGNGGRTLPGTLRDPPGPLKTCTLWKVVMATYNMGETGCRKLCKDAKVWPYIQIDELTQAEVERIIQHLPKRAQ